MKIKKNPTIILAPFILLRFLFFFSWIFNIAAAAAAVENTKIPVNVGVVVDLDAPSGKTYLSCIKMALPDFYASHAHFNTRLVLHTRNSNQTVVGAAAAALDLIKNVEVQAILGPETSMQASFVVNLGDEAHVPIVSFSASSPSLASLRSPYFFRVTQTDSYQVKAISSIVKNFGWRHVVPIYVDNTFGEGVIPFLVDALQKVDAHVPYRSVIPPSATDEQIEKELYKLMTMQTRVFIVHMMPHLCSKLFAMANKIGMMSEGYVWITTNGAGNRLRSLGPVVLSSMQGVLGVETEVPTTMELTEFKMRWKRQFQQDNPAIIDVYVDVIGLRAYDAAFALALAAEQVGDTSFSFQERNGSFSSTDLDTFKVSQYGPKLAQALSNTRFKGIAGDFSLDCGQLQSSRFQILNVNGDGVRTIAFWTPENGMVKTLSSTNTSILSTSEKCDFGTIIWPGDSLSVPKGWEIPTSGKKLKIGVPVKVGFTEFVKVTKIPSTNTTDVTGFSIDVFNAAVEVLPYALPFEFIPFENPDGTSAGTYNDLVYQVYLEYDAVVGDTTIRANRSLYVDFTMPYTESGVVMVVPIRDTRRKCAWVFLKPLTWDLWLTTFCFFIFIGFVVWVLEHRINEDFRGPPSHQVGTSFWFSFSTMVFSHRERVVSNLARFLMIIWVFVVLVLTQSYTANLASLLTVEQLQPTVTDIKDLLRNGDNVGYIENTYVCEILKQLGFDNSKLKPIKTMEECDVALSKGSAKGGIAAVVDEIPNMKLLVAKYCSKYTMIGPIFKTDGFAFVFPKHSPLVPDLSQAVLNVTGGEKIMNIENKWFSQESKCEDKSTTPRVSSNSLGLESFWGLFLIAGMASILALIIFLASFLYKHRHVLKQSDSRASKWRRVRAMFEIFNDKDISSHTFKSSQQRDGIGGVGDEVKASPNSNWPESPFSYLDHTDMDFVLFEGQQTPSTTSHASPEIVPKIEHDIITVQEMHTTPVTDRLA
ncbi:glutamate receptor 2.8 isoform X2 [Prunus persica]|uniref:glutamate receptor 2.8 isoform X2 n=1 Tax=Prunus persica TaxID=3760 RepID=UPI0009AB4E8E|nr:glutamate receptor 2.8 isoform X2 [Prunus persica]